MVASCTWLVACFAGIVRFALPKLASQCRMQLTVPKLVRMALSTAITVWMINLHVSFFIITLFNF